MALRPGRPGLCRSLVAVDSEAGGRTKSIIEFDFDESDRRRTIKHVEEEDDFWEPEPMPALLRDKYIKRPHPFEG